MNNTKSYQFEKPRYFKLVNQMELTNHKNMYIKCITFNFVVNIDFEQLKTDSWLNPKNCDILKIKFLI